VELGEGEAEDLDLTDETAERREPGVLAAVRPEGPLDHRQVVEQLARPRVAGVHVRRLLAGAGADERLARGGEAGGDRAQLAPVRLVAGAGLVRGVVVGERREELLARGDAAEALGQARAEPI